MELSTLIKYAVGMSVVCLIFMSGCQGTCTYEGAPDNHTTVATDLTKYTGGFATDDVVVFECEDGNGRFGVVKQYCQSNGEWTNPDRDCLGRIGVDGGSIAGICMAGLNIVIAVSSIIISKHYRKKKQLAEEESQ